MEHGAEKREREEFALIRDAVLYALRFTMVCRGAVPSAYTYFIVTRAMKVLFLIISADKHTNAVFSYSAERFISRHYEPTRAREKQSAAFPVIFSCLTG